MPHKGSERAAAAPATVCLLQGGRINLLGGSSATVHGRRVCQILGPCWFLFARRAVAWLEAAHLACTLRAGYIITRPDLPKFWYWMYYGNPLTYVLYVLSVQIYGDNQSIIVYGQNAQGEPQFLTIQQARPILGCSHDLGKKNTAVAGHPWFPCLLGVVDRVWLCCS
jgi:hypothetical protein